MLKDFGERGKTGLGSMAMLDELVVLYEESYEEMAHMRVAGIVSRFAPL